MSTQQSAKSRLPRFLVLAAAAAVVVIVAVFAFTSGDDGDDEPAADPNSPFGGTPISELPGIPTPVEGTGMLGPGRPDIGEPAPDFALADVRDPSVVRKLSDFHGTPIVLNWYASWCEPCKKELPEFVRVQELLGDEVQFVSVNYLEERDRALSILEEFDVEYPALLDPSGTVSERYRVTFMPTTYFIDGDGVVVSWQVGEVTASELSSRLADLGLTYQPQ